MKKIILLLFIITAFLLIHANIVFACSCLKPGTPTEELKEAAAIFSGKVVDINRDFFYIDINREFLAQSYKVKFDVERSWKGVSEKTISVKTGLGGGDCGYNFEKDESYLVYAYNYTGDLVADICTRTIKLANAQEDLDELGTGTTPPQTNGDTESNNLILLIVAVCLLIVIAIIFFKIRK